MVARTNIAEVAQSIRENLLFLRRALYHLQQDLSDSVTSNARYVDYKRDLASSFQTRFYEIYANINRRSEEAHEADDEVISKKYLEKDEPRRQAAAALWLGEYIIENSHSPQTIAIARRIVFTSQNLTANLGFVNHARFADNGFIPEDILKILKHRDNMATVPELSEPPTWQQVREKLSNIVTKIGSLSLEGKGR